MKRIRTILIYIILKRAPKSYSYNSLYKNHINLHHSQTSTWLSYHGRAYKNHINLHHSQTMIDWLVLCTPYKNHINLHHSQTSVTINQH